LTFKDSVNLIVDIISNENASYALVCQFFTSCFKAMQMLLVGLILFTDAEAGVLKSRQCVMNKETLSQSIKKVTIA